MRVMRNYVTAPPDFWIMSAQSGGNAYPQEGGRAMSATTGWT
jgi:hypothetical protein